MIGNQVSQQNGKTVSIVYPIAKGYCSSDVRASRNALAKPADERAGTAVVRFDAVLTAATMDDTQEQMVSPRPHRASAA